LTLVLNPVEGHGSGPYEALWYAEPYFSQIRDYLAARGLPPTYLYRGEATGARVWDSLARTHHVYVVGVGHGSECYSGDTEILTENGWKRFYELEPGEKVATLNPESGELEYQAPTAYHKYWYEGPMLLIEGRRVNLLVTPNHRLYVRMVSGGRWTPYRFLLAEELRRRRVHCLKFKRGARWNCLAVSRFTLPPVVRGSGATGHRKVEPPREVDIVSWLRFFGIWLAEGCVSLTPAGRSRPHSKHHTISITQMDERKLEVVKEWVGRVARQIGASYWVERTGRRCGGYHSVAIRMKNKQLYEYLARFGKARDKYIPKWIKNLPPRLLRELLNALLLGDGSNYTWIRREDGGVEIIPKRGNYVKFYTSSRRLADDVQEIAMKLGVGATITMDKRTGVYRVSISDDEVCVTKRSIKWVDYRGYVYCVTVPNGIIYVRRKGKAVWCGNSVYTGYRLDYVFFTDMRDGGYSPEWTSGTVFLLLSCLTAKELGPYMTDVLGAWSYLGWDVEYAFWLSFGRRKGGSWWETPDLLFLRPVEEAFSMCAAGEVSPGGAYDHIYRSYTAYLEDPEIPDRFKPTLRSDRDHMRLLGHREHPPEARPPAPSPVQAAAALIPMALVAGVIGISEAGKYTRVGVI